LALARASKSIFTISKTGYKCNKNAEIRSITYIPFDAEHHNLVQRMTHTCFKGKNKCYSGLFKSLSSTKSTKLENEKKNNLWFRNSGLEQTAHIQNDFFHRLKSYMA